MMMERYKLAFGDRHQHHYYHHQFLCSFNRWCWVFLPYLGREETGNIDQDDMFVVTLRSSSILMSCHSLMLTVPLLRYHQQ